MLRSFRGKSRRGGASRVRGRGKKGVVLRATRPGILLLIALVSTGLGASSYAAISDVVEGAAAPTIATDKADYGPGEPVTLTASGWQPGEAVHILVNDEGGQTWTHDSNPDPVADANGDFTYEFDLPDWFVATYSVKATGASGSTATTSFSDAFAGYYTPGVATGTGYTGANSCTSPGNVLDSDDPRAACVVSSGQNVAAKNFNLHAFVPSSATNIRFNVEVEANRTGTSSDRQLAVSLSWDGGTTFGAPAVNTGNISSTTDQFPTAPSSATTCSTFNKPTAWSYADLSDANFVVRAQATGGSSGTVNIDRIRVKVCWDGSSVQVATLAGAYKAMASPGASLPHAVQVDHTHAAGGTSDDWRATSYRVEGQSAICINHSDRTSGGTGTQIFNSGGTRITAPAAAGTYDVTYVAYNNNTCDASAAGAVVSQPFTLTNAIEVGIFGDSFGVSDVDNYAGASFNNWADGDGG